MCLTYFNFFLNLVLLPVSIYSNEYGFTLKHAAIS